MNFNRIVEVALAAQRMGGPGPLSTGEALTAALVLNRHDWLKAMGYTIAETLDRIDRDTIQHLRAAERHVQEVAFPPAVWQQPEAGAGQADDDDLEDHEVRDYIRASIEHREAGRG